MMEQKKLRFFGIGKILPFLRPFRKDLMVMMVLGLISSGTDILLPLFQRYALDHFVVQKTLDTIWVFTAAYFLTYCLAAVVNYISCTLATVIEVKVGRDMRQAAFNHLQKLSFSYFNQNSVGYIHARLMSDTSRIGTLWSNVAIVACHIVRARENHHTARIKVDHIAAEAHEHLRRGLTADATAHEVVLREELGILTSPAVGNSVTHKYCIGASGNLLVSLGIAIELCPVLLF